SERFETLECIYVLSDNEKDFIKNKLNKSLTFNIEDVILLKDHVKIKFEGYDNRTDADELKNCFLVIDESDKVELPDDYYYYFDLINLKVILNKKGIGFVKAVENYGGDDLLVIELNGTKKNVFIPLRNQFIKKIDLDKKIIDVTLIDGFIE
ncbi:MAG: 16S rRNA processing protein RimM, partial [Bacteroidetes bacterium]|nr:16S rRNA processing protein RimM [Bacteroidota bacterium]